MDSITVNLDDAALSLILAIAMLVAWKIGIWMGRRLLKTNNAKADDAAIAVMSLLLAFAFGSSMLKYDQKRLAVVADSNAIGDFYTCAGLLKEPTRTDLQSVIRQYASLRLELSRVRISNAVLASALEKFDQMHRRMSALVGQAVADGTPVAVVLTNTLNAVSSNQASRLAAIRDQLPTSILILLFASAIIAALLIGRHQGTVDDHELAGSICFIVLVSIAFYVILDLNHTASGLIRASHESFERLVASMRN